MAQSKVVPLREYAVGTYEVELNTLPGNSEGAEIIFTRAGFPGTSADKLAQIDVYMSRDKGVTWGHVMGNSIPGGVVYQKDGVTPRTTSNMLFTWPGEAGPNGRVKLKGSDVKIVAQVFITFSTQITLNSITSTGK